jgi:GNAT superfamily N-acetyltransferase
VSAELAPGRAPTPEPVRIEPLAEHPEALPSLRAWFEAEWPSWYGPEGSGSAEADLRAFAQPDALPVGLVALRGSELLGVGALKASSIPSHAHLRPWAAAGLVRPDLRGQGIGALLLEALAERAREMGYERIYCGTSTSAGLLQRGGWVLEETVEHDGVPLGIYARELGG